MAEATNLNNEKATTVATDANIANSNEATRSTANEGKPVPEASPSQEGPSFEANAVVLERLARQVEYYFSTANLEKDTYVATLRSLNDGYVPISIIANFGKVKTLVPYEALSAVHMAAAEYSDLLEVVHIDTQSGKRVEEDTLASNPELQTVEAVGPKSGQPIPMDKIQSSPFPIKPVTTLPVQNTLIIREAPEGTEESTIRELFTFEKCPQIKELHLDVANCWFVTMDTESKDDMIHVMFTLRTKKFPSGEAVKARLKSAVVATPDVSPVNYRYVNTEAPALFAPQLQAGTKKAGSKKKNNGSKGKNGNAQNGKTKNNGNAQRRNNASATKKQNGNKKNPSRADGKNATPQNPPTLGEDQFPSLPSDDVVNKNKVQVEKVPEQRPEDDMEKARTSSDSASTATTSSSSSSSKNPTQVVGGYAAALLKAAPPAKPADKKAKEDSSTPSQKTKKSTEPKTTISKDKTRQEKGRKGPKKENDQANAAVNVQPPSWGGGRSFADILRKEAAASTATEQAS
mmetsp:Transcript_65834/g.189814  ORF Transcript_65834/g.189814 Transcript_65834/m.189814 type:complete len:517 (+) Transcript_65834:82-1632(+)